LYDEKLLNEYKAFNHQIKFSEFEKNKIKFDFIFLNDVFEHLSNPLEVLKILKDKLHNDKSKIFIDTPKKFWIYNFTSFFNQSIYKKILKGTVDQDHQQIWSKKSFYLIAKYSGLEVVSYKELTEFTQPPSFYLDAMKIDNYFLRLLGRVFYLLAPIIAQNKIMSTLRKN
jgi:2-polyprenyl-3-methyl-5-hydroxy-6-metoxy-1,4-benzoquinol methylase